MSLGLKINPIFKTINSLTSPSTKTEREDELSKNK